jgi:hypothetical protein
MNCTDVIHHLDEHLDATLAPENERAVAAHLEECPDCAARVAEERELRRALRDLPVPPPGQDLLAGARKRARRQRQHRQLTALGSLGIAAGLLLAVVFGPFQVFGDGPEMARTTQVALTPGQTERVKLVFNSPRAMEQVTLHLELPEGVELAGYPNQRRLEWQTRLEAGRNLLELPVVLTGSTGGPLRAGIRYDNQQRSFQLDLTPHRPRESGMIPGGRRV